VKALSPGQTYAYAGLEVTTDEYLMATKTWQKVLLRIQNRLNQYKLAGVGEDFRQRVAVAVTNGSVNYYATVLPIVERLLRRIGTSMMRTILKTQQPPVTAEDYFRVKALWGGGNTRTPLQSAQTVQAQLAIQACRGKPGLEDLHQLILQDTKQMQYGRKSPLQWFWCAETIKLGASMLRSANMLSPTTSHYFTSTTPLWASLATRQKTPHEQPSPLKGTKLTRNQEEVMQFNMQQESLMTGNPTTRTCGIQVNTVEQMNPTDLYKWICLHNHTTNEPRGEDTPLELDHEATLGDIWSVKYRQQIEEVWTEGFLTNQEGVNQALTKWHEKKKNKY